MKEFRLEGCTALITGASAGIGQEFVRQLAPLAGALILVARREDRLRDLRNELTKRDPNLNVSIRAANLSDPESVNALCEWLEHESIAVDFLINNAGLGDLGPFVASDRSRVDEMLSVNIVALTALTHRLLPAMLKQKRGAILNVSSSASFLPVAGMAVYAASKAYVTSFSEALRSELRGTGVRVTALCPGPVHTEFNEVANRTEKAGKFAPEFTHVSVGTVVRAALNAVAHDRPIVIPGLVMKIGMLLLRLTPMPLLRIAAQVTARD